MSADVQRFKIARLGASGDGVARHGEETIYIPGALPGDTVLASRDGERGHLVSIEQEGENRIPPVCQHFGVCGGCAVQAFAPQAYDNWKRAKITDAFAARGLEISLKESIRVGHGARRRAVFTATNKGGETILGFHKAKTHSVFPVVECPILSPEIVKALPQLRSLASCFVADGAAIRVAVTVCENGLDIALRDVKHGSDANTRAKAAQIVREAGWTRVTLDDELLFGQAKPVVRFGTAQVELPPGSFLQAAKSVEDDMVQIALKALPKRTKAIADLFCGLGAFSFPLAAKAKVTSIDGDAPAIAALQAASKATPGLKPITVKVRDLFAAPLSRVELRDFDAVIFDPPRAGGKAQSEALAKSNVPTVVAVSCNPATLARDARILVDGGYKLSSVVPVDQFLYAAHVEAVAVFRK